MYVCEACKPLVIGNKTASQSTPSRKTKCGRCGKEDWCFKVVLIIDEIEFRMSPCSHIKAIAKDLTIVVGWRNEPDMLKYHDLLFKECPTCGDSIYFEHKTIEEWEIDSVST